MEIARWSEPLAHVAPTIRPAHFQPLDMWIIPIRESHLTGLWSLVGLMTEANLNLIPAGLARIKLWENEMRRFIFLGGTLLDFNV